MYDITFWAESESDIRLTTGTPYLPLMGQLSDVFWEDFGEGQPCYNNTALYWPLVIVTQLSSCVQGWGLLKLRSLISP